jgi:hypothetical protein
VWRTETALSVDLRDVLSALRVPTLVITHRDRMTAAGSRYVAEHIEGATSAEVPGGDCLPFSADSVAVLELDSTQQSRHGSVHVASVTSW